MTNLTDHSGCDTSTGPDSLANQPVRSAVGVEVTLADGRRWLDVTAALASCLGHRPEPLLRAIEAVCGQHLGFGPPLFHDTIAAGSESQPQIDFESGGLQHLALLPSVSEAIEAAIQIVHAAAGAPSTAAVEGQAAAGGRRIITLLGADHGSTLGCRAASGRIVAATSPPLVPGFRHVAAGDLAALGKAIDDHTAAVMLAPVDWNAGGVPLAADYLQQVRRLCDQHGLWMIVDESRLPAACSGHWFFHQAAGIKPDLVVASAGWTGGLPGGWLLRGDSVETPAIAEPQQPLLAAVIQATIAEVETLGGPQGALAAIAWWSTSLAAAFDGFPFVTQWQADGLWTVIRLDFEASELSLQLARHGLHAAVSSQTTLLACPPLTLGEQLAASLFDRLRQGLESIERERIES